MATRPAIKGAGLLWLTAVVAAGAALRLWSLNAQSYWYDETFSWATAARPWGEMLPALVADFVQPPLHYIALHGWLALWPGGDAEAGRILFAAFGIACLPATYWLGRELYDRRTALIGVALMAVSQTAILYSQEVRPYSQFLFFTLLAAAFYVRTVKSQALAPLMAAAVCAGLAMLSHYYSVLTFASLAAWHLFFARDRISPWRIALGVAIVVAAFTPWLLSGVIEAALSSDKTAQEVQPVWFDVNWTTPSENIAAFGNARDFNVVAAVWTPWRIGLSALLYCGPILAVLRWPWTNMVRWPLVRDAVLAVIIAGVGAISGGGVWTLAALALLAAACVAERVSEGRRPLARGTAAALAIVGLAAAQAFEGPPTFSLFARVAAAAPLRHLIRPPSAEESKRDLLLALMVFVPFGVLMAASKLGLQYDIRYILAALPAFYLLTARGIGAAASGAMRVGWTAAVLAYSALGLVTLYTVPYKENYRDAMAMAHAGYRAGDCMVFAPFGGMPDQWRLYGYDDVAVRLVEPGEAATAAGCEGLWVFRYEKTPNTKARAVALDAEVARRRPLIEARDFHWVHVGHYGSAS